MMRVRGPPAATGPAWQRGRRIEHVCAGPLITVTDLEQVRVFPVPPSFRKPPATDSEEGLALI
jgi:hypothetical protein